MAKDNAPIPTDPTLWVWKDACEWMTHGRRCLVRPTGYVTGGRQFCAWHHAVALLGAACVADHFESYCEYVQRFQDHGDCVMETHYPASVTFAWVCGERVTGKPEPCAKYTCSVRIQQEQQTPARFSTPAETAAALAAIRHALIPVLERQP